MLSLRHLLLVGLLIGGCVAAYPPNSMQEADPSFFCTVHAILSGTSFLCAEGPEIRLAFLHGPPVEPGDPYYFGVSAERALERVIPPGTRVRVEPLQKENPEGSTTVHAVVRRVDESSERRSVNQELVREGFALLRDSVAVSSLSPSERAEIERLRVAMEDAREELRGLWITHAFTPVRIVPPPPPLFPSSNFEKVNLGVSVSPEVVWPGDSVHIRVVVTNPSPDSVTLHFTSTCQISFVVEDATGEKVAPMLTCGQAVTHRQLGPEESIQKSFDWNALFWNDSLGAVQPLPPGHYRVYGALGEQEEVRSLPTGLRIVPAARL